LHACIYAHRGRVWIADLQSQNGTQYQGRPLGAAVPVPLRADGEGAPIRLYDQDIEVLTLEG
jgi:serine/threonine-protein kinase